MTTNLGLGLWLKATIGSNSGWIRLDKIVAFHEDESNGTTIYFEGVPLGMALPLIPCRKLMDTLEEAGRKLHE